MMAMNGDQEHGLDVDVSGKTNNNTARSSMPITVGTNLDGDSSLKTGTQRNGPESEPRFTFSAEPTIEDIRRMQAEFTDERNWNQFHQPRNLLLAMVGEVGEVSELFQWRGEVAEGLPNWTDSEREHLAQELSDVMIYLIELAEKCHVDLPQAVLRKMALNKLKYPASKVNGSSKKYTEYQD